MENIKFKCGSWRDKILFTPGPLTTSKTVKTAMLKDTGSRDHEFIDLVADIRNKLLDLAGVKKGEYEAILLQGSGTYGLEAVAGSVIPRKNGKLLIIINGAYGKRMAKICQILDIDYSILECPENQTPEIEALKTTLETDSAITHVSAVHCETTTGIMNPIEEIGAIVKHYGKGYIVDAMSSFGAVLIDMKKCGVDYLVTSSNKCIEGVPGFSIIIAKKISLLSSEGNARSLSLDILDQWRGLENNGQFRFTPPTHALHAFAQALAELESEGGIEARGARYKANHELISSGMKELGFNEYLPENVRGYIISSYIYPEDKSFSFDEFYERLNKRNYVIYPGKLSSENCFRIGSVGRIFSSDVRDLLNAIKDVLQEMQVKLI
jgi:2-aminoethylphosphonate-pyruvate transaminase